MPHWISVVPGIGFLGLHASLFREVVFGKRMGICRRHQGSGEVFAVGLESLRKRFVQKRVESGVCEVCRKKVPADEDT